MTSPGTYSVMRGDLPLPYLSSTELEPPADQATSVGEYPWKLTKTSVASVHTEIPIAFGEMKKNCFSDLWNFFGIGGGFPCTVFEFPTTDSMLP
ncbi:unnamed protein product, partial [Larinioides sclopetarius]